MAARRSGGGRVLLTLAVAVAAAACGAGTSGTGTAGTATTGKTPAVRTGATTGPTAPAGACPASADAGAGPGTPAPTAAQSNATPATPASDTTLASGASAGPLIRRGAVTAVICQYTADPSKKTAGMLGRVTLGAAAAGGLAALFDDAGQTASPPRCAGSTFSQVVIFGFRSGPAVTASVRFGVCSVFTGVVTAGGRAAVFGNPLESDLFGYSELGLLGPGPLIPDVTGLSPAAATTVAKRHGLTLLVDGAELDTSVPAGTVIFQWPPPVADNPGPGSQLEVIVATPHAPACTPAQLTVSYRGGEAGAGSDFGSIVFRDTSAAACALAGQVSVTGVNTAGDPVTASVTSTFAGPGTLSPDAAPVPDGRSPPPGEIVYLWLLTSEYRDGPANVDNGICEPDWVVPASWRITLASGATFTVANSDPDNSLRLVTSGGLVTCLGRLSSAAQPASMSP
jgi:hypothetical protein